MTPKEAIIFATKHKTSGMKYSFKIIETNSKSVEVEAVSEEAAFEKVRESYEAGEIKLDTTDDFEEWEIFPE